MKEEKVYLIGYFDCYGWKGFYGAPGTIKDFDYAEKMLNKALTDTNEDWKIFAVDTKYFEPVSVDSGLMAYNKLLKNVIIESFLWQTEDLKHTIDVIARWKYSMSKKLVTIGFEYSCPSVYEFKKERNETKRKKLYDEMMSRFYYDLQNRVKFMLEPQVREYLKANDLDIKVEFRNNFRGEKLNKGYITK